MEQIEVVHRPLETNRLWDELEVARFLSVSVEFLQQDRGTRRRIPYVKIGRAVRYDPADVLAFRDACKVR
jgi:hypothetical protein